MGENGGCTGTAVQRTHPLAQLSFMLKWYTSISVMIQQGMHVVHIFPCFKCLFYVNRWILTERNNERYKLT